MLFLTVAGQIMACHLGFQEENIQFATISNLNKFLKQKEHIFLLASQVFINNGFVFCHEIDVLHITFFLLLILTKVTIPIFSAMSILSAPPPAISSKYVPNTIFKEVEPIHLTILVFFQS